MKRIQVTFIGQDSLGYEHGKQYELFIEKLRFYFGFHSIRICRRDYQGFCPYQNIETFLENWTDIRVDV